VLDFEKKFNIIKTPAPAKLTGEINCWGAILKEFK